MYVLLYLYKVYTYNGFLFSAGLLVKIFVDDGRFLLNVLTAIVQIITKYLLQSKEPATR